MVLPYGFVARSSLTATSKSSDGRESTITSVTSLSARKNSRTVARPMPFDAPVTMIDLLIVCLVSEQVAGELDVDPRGDLEVAVGAFDEAHVESRDSAKRRVLGERDTHLTRVRVRGHQRRLRELLRQLYVAQG